MKYDEYYPAIAIVERRRCGEIYRCLGVDVGMREANVFKPTRSTKAAWQGAHTPYEGTAFEICLVRLSVLYDAYGGVAVGKKLHELNPKFTANTYKKWLQQAFGVSEIKATAGTKKRICDIDIRAYLMS